MPKRLTERYNAEAIRLKPESYDSDRRLVSIVQTLRAGGSTYHLLAETPFNDGGFLFVILIDDQAVVSFELEGGLETPQEVEISTFEEYRLAFGQGRHRLLLDRAAQAGRAN